MDKRLLYPPFFHVEVDMTNENKELFDSPAYKRSRTAYKWECTFEYFVALLVGDAFLAKLLTSLGFTDAEAGIVSSLITLAFLFQLLAVFVVRKITNTKLIAIIFHTTSQLFFMSLYLIPFMPFAAAIKKPLVVACIVVAYFGNYMVSTVIFRWGNSFVEPGKRASFTAGKEIISLVSGMVVSFAVGYIMNQFEATNNLKGGFIFAAIAIFIFCLSDLTMLLLIKNDKKPKVEKGQGASMKEIVQNTFFNKSFMSVVVLTILWDSSRFMVIGFLGTYKNMLYSLSVVQLVNIIAQFGRAVFSKPFARYTQKRTFAKGVELGLVIAATAMFVNIFTTPATAFLIIIYTVLYNVCMAGVSGNLTNITYSYVDSRYFAEASAIKNSIGGIFGFCASLVGGKILAAVQANGNVVFGIHMYGQQLLSAISFLMMIITILFAHFVVSRQKVMIQ